MRVTLLIAWALAGPAAADVLEMRYDQVAGGAEDLVVVSDGTRMVVSPGRDGAIYADFAAGRMLGHDVEGGVLVDMAAMGAAMQAMGGGQTGAAAAIAAAQAEAMAQMQDVLEAMPAEQRALAEAAVRDALGLGAGEAPAPAGEATLQIPAVLTFDGTLDTPAGRFDVVSVAAAGPAGPVRRYQAADLDDVAGGAEMAAAVARLADLYAEVMGDALPSESGLQDVGALAQAGLFAVAVEDLAAGARWDFAGIAPGDPAALVPPDLPIRTTLRP